jgi:cellulose synthase/poly-beta-1,6-N-acetylglucosamine synthase-like glycosyltransferase
MNLPIGTTDTVFAAIALASWLIMAWFYLLRFTAAGRKNKETGPGTLTPVSIIVCAHNEWKNLEHLIPALLGQDYQQFEVVIVDDGSWDGTADQIRNLSERFPQLKLVRLDHEKIRKSGKKLALTLGIKAARYDHFLLTDADCMPAGNQWLKGMAGGFSQEKSIVLGFAPYRKKRGLLNLFIRFETLVTAMQYLALARIGKAYMGVGRNLAYTRQLFFNVKGFASHHHLPAGDDDLFVQEVANSNNTAVVVLPETFTYSEPPSGFAAWWKQKRRHLHIGKHYAASHRWRLMLLGAVQILFYVNIAIWPWFTSLFWLPLGAYVLWLMLRISVLLATALRLQQQAILWAYPLLDLLYACYLLAVGFNAWLAKRTAW